MDKFPVPDEFGRGYLRHEACPQCRENGRDRAGNNLAVYHDHAWCFSCQYYEARKEGAVKHVIAQIKEDVKENKPIALPDDAQKGIDVKALQWLDKYGIIRNEIIEHDLRWSPSRHALFFPIRGANDELLAWQARCFSPNDKKWDSRGPLGDIIHIIGDGRNVVNDPVVLVEDIVSAIKVGRQCRAMPLFGSEFAIKRLARLRHLTRKLIFWLDADKFTSSVRRSKNAQMLGMETRVIYTEKDPKEYNDQEIFTALSL